MTIQEIAQDMLHKSDQRRPQVIAIEGFGGSGKSTIAEKLAHELGGAYVVGIDDFIVKEKLAETSWDGGAFDRKRLEQQVLRPLSEGKHASYQKLDWAANTLSKPVPIPNVDYVIVEGITAYHPDIAQYYDFKIWIDTPLEVAQKRGHAREGSNENAQHWDLWTENDRRYQQRYHPERQADYTITN